MLVCNYPCRTILHMLTFCGVVKTIFHKIITDIAFKG